MEKTLRLGGYNAMRGHGGIAVRIIRLENVTEGDKCQVI